MTNVDNKYQTWPNSYIKYLSLYYKSRCTTILLMLYAQHLKWFTAHL